MDHGAGLDDGMGTEGGERFQPTPRLRKSLLTGAVAALAGGVVSATRGAVEWGMGAAGGTIGSWLEVVAIGPEVLVLMTVLALAREVESSALRRAGLGLFATGWMLGILDAAEGTAWYGLLVGLVGVATLFLLYKVFSGSPGASKTAETAETEEAKGLGKVIGGGAVALFGIVKLMAKVAAFRALRRLNLGLENWAMIVTLVLVGLLLIFALWFALTKIRLRDRLGPMSAVSGWIDLGTGAAFMTGGGLFLITLVRAMAANPVMTEQDVERLAAPWMQGVNALSIIGGLATMTATALMFLAIRAQGDPDWRFDFDDDGSPPALS